tara:strand:+ start:1361 stop:2080 length:720 start_codon:yes stop_codon:yes gene_type:complete
MEKPKRIITEEQRLKMAEGRKKALEARKEIKSIEDKRVKNLSKDEKKAEKTQKEELKRQQLQLELEALEQQKDRIEAKKQTMENRKLFRDKVKIKIEPKTIEPEPEPEPSPEPSPEPVKKTAPARDTIPEPVLATPISNKDLFNKHAQELIGRVKNPETSKLLKSVTSKYDNDLDITQNLNAMSKQIKSLIKDNLKQIKSVDKTISKVEVKEPVENKKIEELKVEHKYKSKLAHLMRVR